MTHEWLQDKTPDTTSGLCCLCICPYMYVCSKVWTLSLFIPKLRPKAAVVQTRILPWGSKIQPPHTSISSPPRGRTESVRGWLDISGITKPFSTPKLFIFTLSWHFNTPPCGSTDPLPGMNQTPPRSCQLEAKRPNLRFDKTEDRNDH